METAKEFAIAALFAIFPPVAWFCGAFALNSIANPLAVLWLTAFPFIWAGVMAIWANMD